jgi:uncharacterized protein
MNTKLIEMISAELNIDFKIVNNVFELLDDNNTIPFIARYRKEYIADLTENDLFEIEKKRSSFANFIKRKDDIIRLIDEKGLLTPELKSAVENAETLKEIETIYEPFKTQKITKATKAIELGLLPIATIIFNSSSILTIEELIQQHKQEIKTTQLDEIISGINDILQHLTNTSAKMNTITLEQLKRFGKISTKKNPKFKDDKAALLYETYFDFTSSINYIKSYQIMAINRAESEKIIQVKLEANDEQIKSNLIKYKLYRTTPTSQLLADAIITAYSKLIKPKLTREIRNDLTNSAHEQAINIFGDNLAQILMQRPLKGKTILGIDPGFVSGCKTAIIDSNGKVLDIDIISVFKKSESKNIIIDKLNKFPINLIAIGNGTASRETEEIVAQIAREYKIDYAIVDERGASVYSASKIAIQEFPNLNVEQRSAVSIARRLQDPLSELVKINPESIGIGQYQHDINKKDLASRLDFETLKIVNKVGVNLNTASKSVLEKIAGLSPKIAQSIIEYRIENNMFNDRMELKKVKGLGPKAFEQAAGFLRVDESKNILDKTIIHPESYKQLKPLVRKYEMTKLPLDISVEEIIPYTNSNQEAEFVLHALTSSVIDPRDELDLPLLRQDIQTLEDLEIGMELEGTVNNITAFGVFVDIGVKRNGLIHHSKLGKSTLILGAVIKVRIEKINKEKGHISLEIV